MLEIRLEEKEKPRGTGINDAFLTRRRKARLRAKRLIERVRDLRTRCEIVSSQKNERKADYKRRETGKKRENLETGKRFFFQIRQKKEHIPVEASPVIRLFIFVPHTFLFLKRLNSALKCFYSQQLNS